MSYTQLVTHWRQIILFQRGIAMLLSDQDTAMPAGAGPQRAEVIANLQVLKHGLVINPMQTAWFKAAANENLDEWQVRNLFLMQNSFIFSQLMPIELVEKLSRHQSITNQAWVVAKPANDWATMQPLLTEMVNLQQQKAELLQAHYQTATLYDGLLYSYAEGNSVALLDPLFVELKTLLPPLRKLAMAKQKPLSPLPSLAVDVQKNICHTLLKKIGYNFDKGRVAETAHPFSFSNRGEAVLAVRYHEDDPLAIIGNAIHEAGHAMASLNEPKEHDCTLVGSFCDIVLQESQSLFLERHVGLHPHFIGLLHQLYQQFAPEWANQVSAADMQAHMHHVSNGFIRIEADELSYPLHVALRYEIERDLINGNLQVADLPARWNADFKDLFGVDVPEYRLGCLQDVHWFRGLFGYFPTYTQGAVAAAQLCAAMQPDVPDFEQVLHVGDCTAALTWQREHMHAFGQLLPGAERIIAATGRPLGVADFVAHLEQRYI